MGALVLISGPEKNHRKTTNTRYGDNDPEIAKPQSRVMFALLLLRAARRRGAAIRQHGQRGPAAVHGTVARDPKRQEEHEAQRNDDDDAHTQKDEPLSSSEPHISEAYSGFRTRVRQVLPADLGKQQVRRGVTVTNATRETHTSESKPEPDREVCFDRATSRRAV